MTRLLATFAGFVGIVCAQQTTSPSSSYGSKLNSKDAPCLKNGQTDIECCAVVASGSCVDGYFYSYDDSPDGACAVGDAVGVTTICTPCSELTGTVPQCAISFTEEASVTTSVAANDEKLASEVWNGRLTLDFIDCIGCEEYYGKVQPTFAWQDCLSGGLTYRQGKTYARLKFDDDACGEDFSPEPKLYAELSAHTISFRMSKDSMGQEPVYVLLAANAGDGSVQVHWTMLNYNVAIVMDFAITTIHGEVLGLTSIPTGGTLPMSNGKATLHLTDFEGLTSDADAYTCSANVAQSCKSLQDAMVEGSWTVFFYDATDIYAVGTEDAASDTCAADTSTPIFTSVTNINPATFATYASGSMVIFVGEPDLMMVSVFYVDFASGDYCLFKYLAEDVTGDFLGMSTPAVDGPCGELYCADIACETWEALGVSHQDLVDIVGCADCEGCLEANSEACQIQCGSFTCGEYNSAGLVELACPECQPCFASESDVVASTSAAVQDCTWWSCG